MPSPLPATSSTVVLLSYHFPPENTSGAARPARFARYLPHFGYRPLVVSAGDRGIPVGPVGERRVPDGKHGAFTNFAISAASGIQQYFLPYDEHLPWVPAAIEVTFDAIRNHGATALISTSPPIATHLAALSVKRQVPIRWVADFRDPLLGNPSRLSRRARLYDPILERAVFRHADAVIANTSGVAKLWERRYPEYLDKIHLIWNGFDPQEALPCFPAGGRKQRLLAHVGVLYAHRHPGALLWSVDRLIRRGLLDPASFQIQLVGLTEGMFLSTDQPPFTSLVEMGCLRQLGEVPRTMAQQIACSADFLLLLDLVGENAGLQVPAKLFDYVRTGKPILAFTSRDSSTEYILARSGIQYRCIYIGESELEIDGKVMEFFSLPPSPGTPSPWFLSEFNALAQTKALCALIDPQSTMLPCSDSTPTIKLSSASLREN